MTENMILIIMGAASLSSLIIYLRINFVNADNCQEGYTRSFGSSNCVKCLDC